MDVAEKPACTAMTEAPNTLACRYCLEYNYKEQRNTRFRRMGDDRYWVYIVTNRPNGVLYIGVTNDLDRRLWEHRSGLWRGFTARYNAHRLVWMAGFDNPEDAIATEKRMKKWNRAWKIREIEAVNPDWEDLRPGDALL